MSPKIPKDQNDLLDAIVQGNTNEAKSIASELKPDQLNQIGRSGELAINKAAEIEQVDVVAAISTNAPNSVSQKNDKGEGVLHASSNSSRSTRSALLSGADVEGVDKSGNTPSASATNPQVEEMINAQSSTKEGSWVEEIKRRALEKDDSQNLR